MDWEKQDNELRQLMEGGDYLPDEDGWNADAGWRKLQEKRKPLKKGVLGYWMQLAAAACVVGMLGLGLWWIQKNSTSDEKDRVVKSEEIERTPGINKQAIEQSNHKPISTSINREKKIINNSLTIEAQLSNKKFKPIRENMLSETPVNIEKVSSFSNKSDDAIVANIGTDIGIDKNSVNAVLPTTSEHDIKPDIVISVPVKKPKIRVIHYNELNGTRSTAPPVFVRTKKLETEWENLSVQNAIAQGSQPYSLKIDISPAPKKSL